MHRYAQTNTLTHMHAHSIATQHAMQCNAMQFIWNLIAWPNKMEMNEPNIPIQNFSMILSASHLAFICIVYFQPNRKRRYALSDKNKSKDLIRMNKSSKKKQQQPQHQQQQKLRYKAHICWSVRENKWASQMKINRSNRLIRMQNKQQMNGKYHW